MLNETERRLLYQGQLRVAPAGPGGQVFAEEIWTEIRNHFGPSPRVPSTDFLDRLGSLRAALSLPLWRERSRLFLGGLGLDLEQFAIDRFRLRGVTPGSHLIAAAAPAFYIHRDTWYGNPQAQINLWMPLHDVGPGNSFGFYPELFETAVANDSDRFDYDEFLSQAGFQNPQRSSQAVYPRWLEERAPTWPVELCYGQMLLFSAAHLHGTLPNLTEEVRFSIDVRLVHRDEAAQGKGAPNLDNRCRGAALKDYTW